MRDFPPPTGHVAEPHETGAAGPGRAAPPSGWATPDTRSPVAFLWWLARQQLDVLGVSLFFALVWMVPLTAGPWILGRTIDAGILAGDAGATTRWILLLTAVIVVGAGCGVWLHTFVLRSWLITLYGVTDLVTASSLRLGHVLPRRTPTGEALSISGSDANEFSRFLEVAVRGVSHIATYLVVAAIVLSTSLRLGLLVLLAAPLLVASAWPFMGPMERWQRVERTRNSRLTSQATDIVAGLRILRGIGGEATFGDAYAAQSQKVRQAGTRAAVWQAAVEGAGVLLSGVLVVAVVYLGVGEVVAGRLTIGQLVAFLGYALMLVQPMRTFFDFVQKFTRARVSAARTIALVGQTSPWRTPHADRPLPATGDLVDRATGLTVQPGRLTMLVCPSADEGAAIADRLGRYLPRDDTPQEGDDAEEDLRGRAARRAQRERLERRARRAEEDARVAAQAWGVTYGGVDLADVGIGRVRERIVVSDTTAQVFAGTLQQAVDPHGRLTRQRAEQVLHAAAAEDVYDALPGGWQGVVEERGRGLSGGQRQRLVLARALAADPDVLVLVEPTSAVDAHTEDRIAQRLPQARAGRTTLVVTSSPLLLRVADEVALVADGRVAATGTHDELIATSPRYRAVVARGADAVDAPGASAPSDAEETR